MISDIPTQAEFWGNVADTRDFNENPNLAALEKYLAKDAKILDYGCGYGRLTDILYQQGYKDIVGLDISEQMIATGHAKYPHLNLSVLNSKTIPYEDNHFDAVILFTVLTCIAKDEDQEALMAELKRVLKPNGMLYLCEFLLGDDERNLNRYEEFQSQFNCYGVFELEPGIWLRHHAKEWLQTLTQDFEWLWSEEEQALTMNGNPSNKLYVIGKLKS